MQYFESSHPDAESLGNQRFPRLLFSPFYALDSVFVVLTVFLGVRTGVKSRPFPEQFFWCHSLSFVIYFRYFASLPSTASGSSRKAFAMPLCRAFWPHDSNPNMDAPAGSRWRLATIHHCYASLHTESDVTQAGRQEDQRSGRRQYYAIIDALQIAPKTWLAKKYLT